MRTAWLIIRLSCESCFSLYMLTLLTRLSIQQHFNECFSSAVKKHFSSPASSGWFIRSCCRRCLVKWLRTGSIQSINYSQQTLLMVFVLCVVSQSSGTQENQIVDGEWGWIEKSVYTACWLHQPLSGFSGCCTKDYGQTLQTRAVWVDLIYYGDGGRTTTSFPLWGWELLTHQDDTLSRLHRGPQWVIGSCGGGDIGTKPMSRGIRVGLRGSESLCVFMHFKPLIEPKALFTPH